MPTALWMSTELVAHCWYKKRPQAVRLRPIGRFVRISTVPPSTRRTTPLASQTITWNLGDIACVDHLASFYSRLGSRCGYNIPIIHGLGGVSNWRNPVQTTRRDASLSSSVRTRFLADHRWAILC